MTASWSPITRETDALQRHAHVQRLSRVDAVWPWLADRYGLIAAVDAPHVAHPERFSGDAGDGFDVIAPSLPGYGFSQAPPEPMGPQAIAALFSRLMADVLGYERYVAQGGDWGSIIVARMALDHPERLAAVHFNMAPMRPYLGDGAASLSEAEQAWIEIARRTRPRETAYQDVHATKSQSLAYGLTDSPVGLAGWITEKFHGWSTPDADEPPFSMDQLLTNIMIYWVTGSMNSSTWLYRAVREEPSRGLERGQKIELPMGFCLPANDLVPPPPPEWLQRMGNVVHDHRLDDATPLCVRDVLLAQADETEVDSREARGEYTSNDADEHCGDRDGDIV